jgi:acetyl esterase/lipase
VVEETPKGFIETAINQRKADMRRTISAFLLLMILAACARETPAPPTETPTPAPTPTPTFSPVKFGAAEKDVTYCVMGGKPQKMDVYYPKSGGPWPVFVYVHGGSWRELDKAEGEGWRGLNDVGYLVVSLNYRLADLETKFPAMIEDVKCAIRYLRAHSAEYNLDPDRFGALGASAGGHLVDLLGTSDTGAGWDVGDYLGQSSRVQAVVSISGITDFTQEIKGGVAESIFYVFGALAGSESPLMAAASPVTYVTADDPPFLIFHGDQDGVVPVDQAYALYKRLLQEGVSSTLVIVKGGDHGLNPLPGRTATPNQDEIGKMIVEFLDKNLK